MNALHYFVITKNQKGVEYCFECGVAFIIDDYGKSPFDYAKQSKNRKILDAVLKGIYQLDYSKIKDILNVITFNSLIEEYSPELIPVLKDLVVSKPIE